VQALLDCGPDPFGGVRRRQGGQDERAWAHVVGDRPEQVAAFEARSTCSRW